MEGRLKKGSDCLGSNPGSVLPHTGVPKWGWGWGAGSSSTPLFGVSELIDAEGF